MAYDKNNPASIFEGNNISEFMAGINNAYRLQHGMEGGDPHAKDVGHFMVQLSDAREMLKDRNDDPK